METESELYITEDRHFGAFVKTCPDPKEEFSEWRDDTMDDEPPQDAQVEHVQVTVTFYELPSGFDPETLPEDESEWSEALAGFETLAAPEETSTFPKNKDMPSVLDEMWEESVDHLLPRPGRSSWRCIRSTNAW